MSMDFALITKAIKEKLSSPEGKLARETTAAGIGAMNPAAGVISTGFNSFLEALDEYKLRHLCLGLSKDIDMERKLNELYEYVTSSPERAFATGNVLKKTIAAESPRVCMLYGLILSKHIGQKKTDFSRDDMIVYKALENASDYDLDNFKDIMENCVRPDDDGKKRIVYGTEQERECELTCQWCVSTRLFKNIGLSWGTAAGGVASGPDDSIIQSDYYVTNPAELLMDLICELGTRWDYGQ